MAQVAASTSANCRMRLARWSETLPLHPVAPGLAGHARRTGKDLPRCYRRSHATCWYWPWECSPPSFGLTRAAPAAGRATPDAQAKFVDAMSAGPATITKDATILDWAMDANGKFVVLRQGSNTWSCLPD